MSEALRCDWCGKLIAAGDTADDPRPGRGGRLHVRCTSRCRDRMRCWDDLKAGQAGELASLAEQLVAAVRGAGGRLTVETDSPGFVQLAEAVDRAKGLRP